MLTKRTIFADKAATEMTTALKQGLKCGLMFGPERTGLENDDVSLCDAIINIPLNPKHCSLNLSQAVLLVGYEFYKQQINALDEQFVTNDTTIASKEKLQHFYDFLEVELNNCGNFSIDEKRPRMLRNLRNIFSRRSLTEQEAQELIMQIDNSKKALEEAKNSLKESETNLQQVQKASKELEMQLQEQKNLYQEQKTLYEEELTEQEKKNNTLKTTTTITGTASVIFLILTIVFIII